MLLRRHAPEEGVARAVVDQAHDGRLEGQQRVAARDAARVGRGVQHRAAVKVGRSRDGDGRVLGRRVAGLEGLVEDGGDVVGRRLAAAKQQLQHGRLVVEGREVCRREAERVARKQVGAAADEHLGGAFRAPDRRKMKRRAAVGVGHLDEVREVLGLGDELPNDLCIDTSVRVSESE